MFVFRARCTTLALAIAISSPAAANDASFGGAGAALVPLQETRVRMQSEDIALRFVADEWHVHAVYTFFNDSAKDVRLKLGFPELRCHEFQEECHDVAFRGLATLVDGVPVEHQQGRLPPGDPWESYIGVVWLYDAVFPARRELRVEHAYVVRTGEDTMFNRFTSYVTRTGARWAGPIGRARFRATLPACAHTVNLAQGIALQGVRTIDDPTAPRVEVVYEQRDWAPEHDLWFSFNCSAEVAARRLGEDALARSGLPPTAVCPNVLEMSSLAPEQRTACRDLIYASRGFPFAREDLNRYFYGNPYDWRTEPDEYSGAQVLARGLRAFAAFERAWIDRPESSLLEEAGIVDEPARVRGPRDVRPPAIEQRSSPPQPWVVPPPVPPRGARCGCGVPGSPDVVVWPSLWVAAAVSWAARRSRSRRPRSGRSAARR